MLRPSPRIVMRHQPLRVTSSRHVGWRVQHAETAWRANAHSEIDQTKRRKGCTGKQLLPSRAPHGYEPVAQTMDATDIKARELPSRGCCAAALYNEERPHGAIGNKPPISLMKGRRNQPASLNEAGKLHLPVVQRLGAVHREHTV
ncbi:hypothetical protein IE4872_PA00094 (plasmid) [Rhizobium gallicum]|uniref:IS3 family insertion sequence transposase domain-containing protein n=1 Tax=Rhizobium gallicum TaxID=56730 RepID=A0A1L5NPL0_9HYPH|nr:hypothetical protein IE4872_PA00094 [Rhizobium gallicum]